MKPAFSTVAFPDWTLSRLAQRLEAWGFLGAELRTFGNGSTNFAGDPALTSPAKVRAYFRDAGVDLCCLATGIRYDAAITPPIVGRIFADTERSVRETKGMIDLAVQIECPRVRVFGFELPEGETRKNGLARIVDRLSKSADACRNSGVRLVLENGGSFPKAVDLAEIIDAVGSPLVEASYVPAIAALAGERPEAGVNVLGERLAIVKLKDLRAGRPVELGMGDLRCRDVIDVLKSARFEGWVVYEFDRAWLPTGETPPDRDAIMTASCRRLFEWIGTSVRARTSAARA